MKYSTPELFNNSNNHEDVEIYGYIHAYYDEGFKEYVVINDGENIYLPYDRERQKLEPLQILREMIYPQINA